MPIYGDAKEKQIQAIINTQGINHPAYEDKRLD